MKGKPCINQDIGLFVWQSANVIYVAGQKAVSLLWDRGHRGGLNKNERAYFPGWPSCCDIVMKLCLCLQWGVRLGRKVCLCVILNTCVVEELRCRPADTDGEDWVWPCLNWSLSCFWRFHISNLSSCLPVCWLHNTIYVPRELFRLSNLISMNTAYDVLWIIIYRSQIFDTKQI